MPITMPMCIPILDINQPNAFASILCQLLKDIQGRPFTQIVTNLKAFESLLDIVILVVCVWAVRCACVLFYEFVGFHTKMSLYVRRIRTKLNTIVAIGDTLSMNKILEHTHTDSHSNDISVERNNTQYTCNSDLYRFIILDTNGMCVNCVNKKTKKKISKHHTHTPSDRQIHHLECHKMSCSSLCLYFILFIFFFFFSRFLFNTQKPWFGAQTLCPISSVHVHVHCLFNVIMPDIRYTKKERKNTHRKKRRTK